jgi:hypothetical protein
MCLGQWFPNCGLQTPCAYAEYMMRSAREGEKSVQVLVFRFQKYFDSRSCVC